MASRRRSDQEHSDNSAHESLDQTEDLAQESDSAIANGEVPADQPTEVYPMHHDDPCDGIAQGGAFAAQDDVPTDANLKARREEIAQHPAQIGPFKILSLLGEGGMGAVYLAEQSEPVNRNVALKLIHASLRRPVALARFDAERQAMARLSHPNVAALYEAGTTRDGFPYFAMEYLPGQTLVEYCNAKRLDVRQRVGLFVQVCEGVQHAHQKGLIHRDLKPSNLLVAEVGGQGIPKIIDFGIAKAVDQPLIDNDELTGVGSIGTPAYMSPEAFVANQDLDTRTDVYSLGIVLYELLSGVRPHDLTAAALIRMHGSGTLPESPRLTSRLSSLGQSRVRDIALARRMSPGQLAECLRTDLDWIVSKAIDDDRDRRYATVAEMAADLTRFLQDQPVLARPPSVGYRIGKFVRRHRLAVGAGSLVLAALVLGIVGTSVGMIRAAREAEAARQVSSFLTRIFEVSDPGVARGNSVTARELLDQGAKRIGSELSDQPLIQARLLRTMGEVYHNLGLYEEADPLEVSALALLRQELGPNDPDVGRSLTAIGTLRNRQGRFPEAEQLQRQAVQVLSDSLGRDSSDTAEAQVQLGLTLFLLGKAEEAEALYGSALATLEAAHGSDSPEVAGVLAHLGFLLNNQERYAEAESALKRSLQIRQSALGEDHYLVEVSLDLLGDVYARQGRSAEAIELYSRSLAIKRLVYAAGHPAIAEGLFALGQMYAAEGRTEDAENSLNAGIELIEASLGRDHINLSRGLQPLGMLLADQGRWQESAAIFERLVGVYETAVGADHVWVAEALNNLGWVLSDGLREYARAETVLRRALAVYQLEPDPSFSGAVALWTLANCLRDQQRYDEAEIYYAQAVEIFQADGGSKRPDNPQLPELLSDYARSLRAAGREADADALESGEL